MSDLLNNLNEEQKQAVVFENGPLMIVAGAGTGKTTVLTKRMAYLILEKGMKPDEVLALTFTEKAAREMEERVDLLLPMGFVDLWITTFHSFCDKILKQHALDIGLSNDYQLLTETDQWILIRKNFDRFDFLKYYKPIGNPTKFISAMIKHFSRLKDEGIEPEEYLEYASNLKTKNREKLKTKTEVEEILTDDEILRIQEIAKSYDLYEKILAENNLMDFGGLINNTLKLFQTRPFILNKYRNKFKYILVDEFQDTNFNQYQLIKILAAPNNNITVVGDDDQAIYKFRGASLSNILNFKNDYPESKEILLSKNYRSAQDILDLSYGFIKQNDPNRLEYKINLSKKLTAASLAVANIEHIHSLTLENEVKSVINRIFEIKSENPDLTYGDFAILVRSNSSAKIFNNLLSINNIPNEFLASTGLYSKDIILDMLAYLKVLDRNFDNASMYRVLSMPIFGIEKREIINILFNVNKYSKSVFAICKNATGMNFPLMLKEKLEKIIALIEKHTNLSTRESVRSIIKYFLVDCGVAADLTRKNDQKQISYINKFAAIVEKFEDSNYDVTLPHFLEYIDLILESGDQGSLTIDEQDPDTVKIMTVHASKGLEFQYVFVVNMVDKKFPVIGKSDPIDVPLNLIKDKEVIGDGDPHLEEERRLFYVAMTRAKKGLIFTSSDDYGGKQKKKLSSFMMELKEIENGLIHQKEDNSITDKLGINFLSFDNVAKENRDKINYYHYDKYSFTQLEGYKNCPLQYKFQYILRIPMSTGRPVFSYGQSMHSTLEEFYKNIKDRTEKKQVGLFSAFAEASADKEEYVSELESIISQKELLKIYDEKFIDEWYDSDKQKQEYYEKGKNSLKRFYSELKNNFIVPYSLEQGFNIKVGDYFMKGKIDRVDILPDGTCEIIDYKTGTGKDEKDVKKDQLMIYQIAAMEVLGLKPSKLTFYYLDDNSKVSFLGTDEQISKLKNNIITWIEEIRQNNFEPKPSPLCKFCDFRDICEFKE